MTQILVPIGLHLSSLVQIRCGHSTDFLVCSTCPLTWPTTISNISLYCPEIMSHIPYWSNSNQLYMQLIVKEYCCIKMGLKFMWLSLRLWNFERFSEQKRISKTLYLFTVYASFIVLSNEYQRSTRTGSYYHVFSQTTYGFFPPLSAFEPYWNTFFHFLSPPHF